MAMAIKAVVAVDIKDDLAAVDEAVVAAVAVVAVVGIEATVVTVPLLLMGLILMNIIESKLQWDTNKVIPVKI